MMSAYNEEYLKDSMENLGEAFDYAVNVCSISPDDFWNLFVVTGYSDQFGKGNPRIICGISGTELVMEILKKAGLFTAFAKPQTEYDCSPEYWCGWILAYYQWKTGRSFRNIHQYISAEDIIKLYWPLHEASEDKFVDTVNKIIRNKYTAAQLQLQRKKCGYSQKELAEKSGVNLRTLQQYELKTKDINKASVQSVLALASALECSIDELLEYGQMNTVAEN